MQTKEIQKALTTVKRNKAFKMLSETQQKNVIKAVLAGRVLLTNSTNKSNKTGGLHYTLNHTGKMKGVTSLSTSVLKNRICQGRQKDSSSVCAKCFSQAQFNTYKNMSEVFATNYDILTTKVLTDRETPIILNSNFMFRVESFGDAANYIQAYNYLKIAKLNPWTKVAIWTKNLHYYYVACKNFGIDIPANVCLNYSSNKLNTVGIDKLYQKFHGLVNHIFTVYTKDFINTHKEININCGARSCAGCKRCYTRKTALLVNEKLK